MSDVGTVAVRQRSERALERGLWLRLIGPDDEARLIDLHARLSGYTAYQRFFCAMKRLPTDWAHRLANIDDRQRLALVIERGGTDGPELIAVARYEPTAESGVAEVAFVVQDDWQGKGLGRLLLRELVAAAEARGIRRFRAFVLADNFRMLRLLSRDTRVLQSTTESGVTEVLFEPQPAMETRTRTPPGRDSISS